MISIGSLFGSDLARHNQRYFALTLPHFSEIRITFVVGLIEAPIWA